MKKSVIIRTEQTKQLAIEYIASVLPSYDAPILVKIEPFVPKRTIDQNSLLHKWLTELAEQTGNEMLVMKEYLRNKFIPPVFAEFKNPETGMYEPKQLPRSTASLNTKEMSKFLNEIDAWACGFGFTLSYPEELIYSIGRT